MTTLTDVVTSPIPGTVAAGRVEFRNVYFRDNGDHTKTVAAKTEKAVLNSTGAMSIELEPGPYLVRRVITGGEDGREYPIEVPATGTWRVQVLIGAYSGAPSASSAIAALLVMLDTRYATTASVTALLGGTPPETLNSIAEIADALGGDPQRVANLVTSVAALNASLAGKADLSGGKLRSDQVPSNLLTKTVGDTSYAPRWQANTAYLAGAAVLAPTGDVVTAKADFTSGSAYSASNWNLSPSYATPAQANGAAVGAALVFGA